MFRFQLFSATIVSFCFTCALFGQQAKKQSETIAFKSAKIIESSVKKTFKFNSFNSAYEIDAAGKISRTRNNTTSKLKSPLDRGETIRLVYFAEYESDVILLYELELFDGGRGMALRLNEAKNQFKWTHSFPAFNVGGFIEGDATYLTGIGYIERISLNSPFKSYWKHEDLYEKYNAFNGFENSSINGNFITFMEANNVWDKPSKAITLNKANGKIVSVK